MSPKEMLERAVEARERAQRSGHNSIHEVNAVAWTTGADICKRLDEMAEKLEMVNELVGKIIQHYEQP